MSGDGLVELSGDELVGPWRPTTLATLDDTTLDGLSYIVVDERVGPYFSVSIEPWPRVDTWGRVRFPRRDEVGHVVLHEELLRTELYADLRDGRPRIGDVFAGVIVPEAKAFIDSEQDFAWERPLKDLVTEEVFDVTEDARTAMKTAYFAAVIPPLHVSIAEDRGRLEESAPPPPVSVSQVPDTGEEVGP